jgi:mannosyltransferase OCH1-like enzyme
MLTLAPRLCLLYKFGGWYADIDTVIMKPLTDFDTKFGFKEEVLVSTDQYSDSFRNALDKDGFQANLFFTFLFI